MSTIASVLATSAETLAPVSGWADGDPRVPCLFLKQRLLLFRARDRFPSNARSILGQRPM